MQGVVMCTVPPRKRLMLCHSEGSSMRPPVTHQPLLRGRRHYSQGVRFEERSHAYSVRCWAHFLNIDKPGKRTLCDDVPTCPVSRTSAVSSDWPQHKDSSVPTRCYVVLVLSKDISSGQSPRRNATAACSRCCPSPSYRSLHSACV
jgi:hypothetical protein